MKVARSTRDRIATIKAEATQPKQHLNNLLIRLQEHAGTKRVAKKLERIVEQLDRWQQVA